MEYMLLPLRRYAEFTGRSRRKEFWMFALFQVAVVAACYMVMGLGGGAIGMQGDVTMGGPLSWLGGVALTLFGLAIIIPSIAVTVRRLHDRALTGWLYLGYFVITFVPVLNIIATIAFFVVMALPGTRGPNKYGADPKSSTQGDIFA